MVGVALSARSTHRLPRTAPAKDRSARRPLGRARLARALAATTSTLLLLTAAAGLTAWALQLQFVAYRVPSSLAPTFSTAAVILVVGSTAAAFLTLVAAGGHLIRRAWRRSARRRDDVVFDLR